MKKIVLMDGAFGTDITEAVQILYDIVHASMDWGSGFLDRDEMRAVITLAIEAGWQVPAVPYNSRGPNTWVLTEFPGHYEERLAYPTAREMSIHAIDQTTKAMPTELPSGKPEMFGE